MVRLQHVVNADVGMLPVGEHNKLPSSAGNSTQRSRLEDTLKPFRISDEDHDSLMDRATEMEDWDHVEEIPVSGDEDSEEDSCISGDGDSDEEYSRVDSDSGSGVDFDSDRD